MVPILPALVRTGFTDLGVERVFAHTMTVNTASRRVMEKCGLVGRDCASRLNFPALVGDCLVNTNVGGGLGDQW